MSKQYDAILLLGVALKKNDEPTDELRMRVKKAVEVYDKLGGQVPIMPCGGVKKGHKRTEAEVMAELLAAEGVPADAIRMEKKSRTTMENFRNATALLGDKAQVLVVTSDYHVRRAVKTAKRVGLRARGIKASLPHDALWICNSMLEKRWMTELKRGWLDHPGARPKEGKKLMDEKYSKYMKRREELLAEADGE